MIGRIGMAIGVTAAIGFVLGVGFWAWQVLAPVDAEGIKAKFSFSTLVKMAQTDKAKAPRELALHVDEAMPATPADLAPAQLFRYGEFNPVNEQHQVRGVIRVFRLGTGEHLLRLEQFNVAKGPGLHVYLTNAAAPRSSDAVLRDFMDLGFLKAQTGAQNYLIPADVDIQDYRGVIVFTPQFNEIYASGSLIDAPKSAPP